MENVGFKNADTASAESVNTIQVEVSDVAKNKSLAKTTEQARIYSDSIAPASPQNFTLKDRASSAATKTIAASTGYTNDEVVDMGFKIAESKMTYEELLDEIIKHKRT